MCGGESTCSNIDSMETNTNIHCHAPNTCSNVKHGIQVLSLSTQCSGVNSCTNNSIAPGGDFFACAGVYSCSNSTISLIGVAPIVGLGAYSLSNSIIYAPNSTSEAITRLLFRS